MLLASERLDIAVSSDLARAAETARIVLGDRTLPLRLDPAWREMRFGTWEGLRWDEITARTPELRETSMTDVRSYAAPDGESFAALCERIGGALERVTSELPADDGTALIVTHAGPLHALLHLTADDAAPEPRVRLLTASICRFERRAERWRLTRLNETAPVDSRPEAGVRGSAPP